MVATLRASGSWQIKYADLPGGDGWVLGQPSHGNIGSPQTRSGWKKNNKTHLWFNPRKFFQVTPLAPCPWSWGITWEFLVLSMESGSPTAPWRENISEFASEDKLDPLTCCPAFFQGNGFVVPAAALIWHHFPSIIIIISNWIRQIISCSHPCS